MKNWIDEGNIVDIYWENIQYEMRVTVIYRPVATGDSWIVKRDDGTIVYVNGFCKMVKR